MHRKISHKNELAQVMLLRIKIDFLTEGALYLSHLTALNRIHVRKHHNEAASIVLYLCLQALNIFILKHL